MRSKSNLLTFFHPIAMSHVVTIMKNHFSQFSVYFIFKSRAASLALTIAASTVVSFGQDNFDQPVITHETLKGANGKEEHITRIDGIQVHETDLAIQAAPPIVTPGSVGVLGAAPADAIILFNGSEQAFTENWTDTKGNPSKWKVVDGELESVKGAGFIQTKQKFGSCQIHIEWASPVRAQGSGQGRGNSGVFLMNTYEVQILDNYENVTYPDGQAGALYGRKKPLVNACRKPGEWQTYDIIFHRPIFSETGKVTRRATFTVLHNGVLIQDHTILSGGTGWAGEHAATDYAAHPDQLPFGIQDHGNPVRFRNIWTRELKD